MHVSPLTGISFLFLYLLFTHKLELYLPAINGEMNQFLMGTGADAPAHPLPELPSAPTHLRSPPHTTSLFKALTPFSWVSFDAVVHLLGTVLMCFFTIPIGDADKSEQKRAKSMASTSRAGGGNKGTEKLVQSLLANLTHVISRNAAAVQSDMPPLRYGDGGRTGGHVACHCRHLIARDRVAGSSPVVVFDSRLASMDPSNRGRWHAQAHSTMNMGGEEDENDEEEASPLGKLLEDLTRWVKKRKEKLNWPRYDPIAPDLSVDGKVDERGLMQRRPSGCKITDSTCERRQMVETSSLITKLVVGGARMQAADLPLTIPTQFALVPKPGSTVNMPPRGCRCVSW